MNISNRRLAPLAGMLAAGAGLLLGACSSLETADWPPKARDAAFAATAGEVRASPGAQTADPAAGGAFQGAWGGQGWSLNGPASASNGLAPTGAAGPRLVNPGIGGANLVSASVSPVPGANGLVSRPGNLPLAGAALRLPPEVVRTRPRLQCVPFARQASGIEIYGNANTWWRQAEGRYLRTAEPAVGAVMAMRGYRNANRGHVAVVTSIKSEREILVDHANWLNRGEVSVNTPVLDVSELGDWSQVRVWHIPSGKWGARIYSVQGFIHQG